MSDQGKVQDRSNYSHQKVKALGAVITRLEGDEKLSERMDT